MRVTRFVVVSVAVHAGLAVAGRAALPIEVRGEREGLAPIAFELVPSELKAPADVVGLGVDGIEPERTTGLPAGPSRGRAGDEAHASAPSIHERGADARDRFASGADAARALTGWIAAGLDEMPDGRSPYDATSALGARDDSSLGVRGSSTVAPGEHGLDMIGTGRAGCVGEDCAAGTIGGTILGPGSLGGRRAQLLASDRGRGWHGRSLCITDDACAHLRRRSSLVVEVEVLGALDPAGARRGIAIRRGAIGSCLERDENVSGRIELWVAPSGAVSRAVADGECLRALGAAIAFPAAAGPSVVTVRASIRSRRW